MGNRPCFEKKKEEEDGTVEDNSVKEIVDKTVDLAGHKGMGKAPLHKHRPPPGGCAESTSSSFQQHSPLLDESDTDSVSTTSSSSSSSDSENNKHTPTLDQTGSEEDGPESSSSSASSSSSSSSTSSTTSSSSSDKDMSSLDSFAHQKLRFSPDDDGLHRTLQKKPSRCTSASTGLTALSGGKCRFITSASISPVFQDGSHKRSPRMELLAENTQPGADDDATTTTPVDSLQSVVSVESMSIPSGSARDLLRSRSRSFKGRLKMPDMDATDALQPHLEAENRVKVVEQENVVLKEALKTFETHTIQGYAKHIQGTERRLQQTEAQLHTIRAQRDKFAEQVKYLPSRVTQLEADLSVSEGRLLELRRRLKRTDSLVKGLEDRLESEQAETQKLERVNRQLRRKLKIAEHAKENTLRHQSSLVLSRKKRGVVRHNPRAKLMVV